MIVGYYEQAFFGKGTYYKTSKKDDESKYKIAYAHSDVLNYVTNTKKSILFIRITPRTDGIVL